MRREEAAPPDPGGGPAHAHGPAGPPAEAATHTTARRPPAPPRRRVRLVLGGVLLVLVGWAVAVALLLVGARGELLQARAAGERGLEAALAADVQPAAEAFGEARERFGRARGRLANPVVGVLGPVPLVGPNLRAVRGLTAAGHAVAEAGERVTGAVAGLPQGVQSLAPSGGTLPVDALAAIGPEVTAARGLLDEAGVALDATPATGVVAQVADARAALAGQLGPARETVTRFEPLVRALPALLGADGPRRYFLGAAQPSELRGSTGFIGAYTIVTLDRGGLGFGDFGAIQDLPVLPPGTVPPPNPDFLDRYGAFGGTGVWQNLNVSPDFPTTGTAVERLWQATQGESLDGTITVDPFALAALLELAGPTEVPGYGAVDAANVVDFVSYDAYAVFQDADARKLLLGRVAAAALGGFLDRGLADAGAEALTALRTLGDVARAGHLRVHAADPAIQAALHDAGLSGALLDPPGDYLAAFVTGASGTKIDYFLQPALAYTATPQPDGGVRGEAQLTLTNDAPTGEQPGLTTGSDASRVPPGTNELYVSTYLSRRAHLEAVLADGRPVAGRVVRELGHPVVETFATLSPGDTRTLSVRVLTEAAWTSSPQGGSYRLTLQRQPTVRPGRLDLTIEAPAGMAVVAVDAPLQVEDGRARFSGELRGPVQIDVQFARIVQ